VRFLIVDNCVPKPPTAKTGEKFGAMPAAFKMPALRRIKYRIKCKKSAGNRRRKPTGRVGFSGVFAGNPAESAGLWRYAERDCPQPFSGGEIKDKELPRAVGQQQIDNQPIRAGRHRLDPRA